MVSYVPWQAYQGFPKLNLSSDQLPPHNKVRNPYSMDNKITLFTFNDIEVRVVTRCGAPWWVAADVAKALGYRTTGEVTRFVRDHQKGIEILDTLGGSQKFAVISEPGLYLAILKSHAVLAEKFQDWVTEEVLPAIRSHGGYLTPEATAQALSDLDFIIRLALRSLRRHAAGKKTGRAGVRAMEALGYVTKDGTITPAGNQALHGEK